MSKRIFAIFLAIFSLCVAAAAQDSADAKKQPEKSFQIFTMGDASFLGVETIDVTRDNFSKYGLREVRGVAVEKVVPDSPAEKAGIQPGDVIVRFENEDITGVRKLTRLISEVAPDHQAKLTISRGGSERELTATLAKRPAPKFEEGMFKTGDGPMIFNMPDLKDLPNMRTLPDMKNLPDVGKLPDLKSFPQGGGNNVFIFRNDARQIGVGITSLTKQLGEYFGVADGKGVLINSVRENSAAAKAGLRAGDVIVEADGNSVNNVGDLMRLLNDKKEGDVNLTVVRDRNRQMFRVTPEKGKDGEGFEFNRLDREGLLPKIPIAPGALTFGPRIL
jgi:serine protease Do